MLNGTFFSTCHGKGPCDAIGGTFKQMSRNTSVSVEHEHPIKKEESYITGLNREVMNFKSSILQENSIRRLMKT